MDAPVFHDHQVGGGLRVGQVVAAGDVIEAVDELSIGERQERCDERVHDFCLARGFSWL